PGGRLYELLAAGEAAGNMPLTWLVDPAVPHAVRRLAAGNPGHSLAAVNTEDDDDLVPATPTPTQGEEGDEPTPDGGSTPAPDPELQAVMTAAKQWLALFNDVL